MSLLFNSVLIFPFFMPILLLLISSVAIVTGTNQETSLSNALNMLTNKQRSALMQIPNLRNYYAVQKRSLNYNTDHEFQRDDFNIPIQLHSEYDDYEDSNNNEGRYLNEKFPYNEINLEHILSDNYNDLSQDAMQPDIDLSNNKKKNINWSEYFGIDRRKKKTGLYAKPETENEDDDWFIKHYYETLVQNLQKKNREMKSSIRNFQNKNKEKDMKRMDNMSEMHNSELPSRFHENVKNFLINDQQLIRNSGAENIENEEELQKIKDIILNGLAASYSLQKMQKALNELRNNIKVQKLPSSAVIPTKER